MSQYFQTGLDGDDLTATDPIDDIQATAAVTTEETLAAQQQAAQALAAQELLAQQQLAFRRWHTWQRMNGSTFRTHPGSWQDRKAFRLAAMGRLVRVSGAGPQIVGYAGELKFKVVNPNGAVLMFRDKEPLANTPPLPPGTICMGTPRGDGYIVELSSPKSAWVNALDLQQLTSADPAPVLASGDYNQGDNMMPATGCPKGTEWSDWYGKCVLTIPAPQPPPVGTTHASGQYVGDGMMPATGCPQGTYWSDYYGKCVSNIPPPPQVSGEYVGDGMMPATGCPQGTYWSDYYKRCVPNVPPPPDPFPDTLDEWRKQHVAGYGWEPEFTGAPSQPPTTTTETQQAQQQQQQQQQQPVTPHATTSNAHVDPQQHASAHAAEANAHAQVAQAIASHPQAPGTGAEKHAAKSYDHAIAATQHAHAVSIEPHRAPEHLHHALHHAHMARRHAAHVRHEGERRGWDEHFGSRGRGWFGGLFGERRHHLHHEHGFSRHFHAHPEWHGWGHPAWRGGIHPMWADWRAECADRSGPRGLFGFVFGWRRRYCAIERCIHPATGFAFYRITPAGMQEGALLDDDMVAANDAYMQQTGQAVPDADAGPLPGSDDKANGALTPDDDDDDTKDEGDADADADATATTATTGEFAGFDLFAHGVGPNDNCRKGWNCPEDLARTRQQRPQHGRDQQHGRGQRNTGRGGSSQRGGIAGRSGSRTPLSPQEVMMLDQQLGVGPYAQQSFQGGGGMPMTSMWGGPHHWHHHHHHPHHHQAAIDPSLGLDEDDDDDLGGLDGDAGFGGGGPDFGQGGY